MKKTLWLVWQNVNTRLFYHVGTLSYYENQYHFQYTYESKHQYKINCALKNGYLLHPMFPILKKEYTSPSLFGAFKRRLPSEKRVDFKEILADLKLSKSYTEMDLLERTRGKLASDEYSFEKPLLIKNGVLTTSFFISGMYYLELPDNWVNTIIIGEDLLLRPEPQNPVDKDAIGIYTERGLQLGYVPRFYTTSLGILMKNQLKPKVIVTYINALKSSSWWIQVNFECDISFLDEENLNKIDVIFQ
ncbi:HIRAN domain-containing protein [Paenibacillus sp. FSL L8-0493]|uniref:HIRAN domain-containing protein n=1 Tax=unclassified Paenibacillus TaxID=185978 RepID=UPI0030DB8ADE